MFKYSRDHLEEAEKGIAKSKDLLKVMLLTLVSKVNQLISRSNTNKNDYYLLL